ncbi:MAG TPA: rhomboid family intramembrane serine protease [Bacteroidales bacterium]|nr:rhomboid family intramembrane serine protease [Bacteroidales bacterium]
MNYSPQGFTVLPPVVKNLLFLNVGVFIVGFILQMMYQYDISDALGLHYIGSKGFKPIQFVSYMFLHANLEHIFFNMFALWMFGNVLENFWGPKRFFTYYMATGIGAGIIQMIVAYIRIQSIQSQVPADVLEVIYTEGVDILRQNKNFIAPLYAELNAIVNVSTVGASGAVFGLLMAFGMLFPNSYIYLFFALPIKAKWFVLGYGVLELFSGIRNTPGDNVAHFAHLGGMVFGYILIQYWRRKGTYL